MGKTGFDESDDDSGKALTAESLATNVLMLWSDLEWRFNDPDSPARHVVVRGMGIVAVLAGTFTHEGRGRLVAKRYTGDHDAQVIALVCSRGIRHQRMELTNGKLDFDPDSEKDRLVELDERCDNLKSAVAAATLTREASLLAADALVKSRVRDQ